MKRFFVLFAMLAVLVGCGSKTVGVAETDETIHNWSLARQYQAQGRYELAQQYYALALSAVRTQSALDMLQREMMTIDMQIRAMR
jgi:hypothetical protein